MITTGKVRNADYYLTELQRDDAYEYYGSLERSGRWHDTLAAELGLAGPVDPESAWRTVLASGSRTTSALSSSVCMSSRVIERMLGEPR